MSSQIKIPCMCNTLGNTHTHRKRHAKCTHTKQAVVKDAITNWTATHAWHRRKRHTLRTNTNTIHMHTHARTYAHTHACTHTHMHARTHTSTHTHTHKHTHMHTHTRTRTHTHTQYTCTRMHTHTHARMHTHTCTHTYTHIHTHMHTHTWCTNFSTSKGQEALLLQQLLLVLTYQIDAGGLLLCLLTFFFHWDCLGWFCFWVAIALLIFISSWQLFNNNREIHAKIRVQELLLN